MPIAVKTNTKLSANVQIDSIMIRYICENVGGLISPSKFCELITLGIF